MSRIALFASLALALAACSEQDCTDGKDNDLDGYTDCWDAYSCGDVPACEGQGWDSPAFDPPVYTEPDPYTDPTSDPYGEGEPTGPSECASVAIHGSTTFSWCDPIGGTGVRAASHLESFWNTAPSGVCAYASTAPSACGAMPADNAVYCQHDDGIYLHAPFMDELAREYGEFASVAFLAHEWGHLNQSRLGLLPGTSNKTVELHADCQAGVYTAFEVSAGRVAAWEVDQTRTFFASIGDRYPSAWGQYHAHGTGLERLAAFDRGYVGGLSVAESMCASDPLYWMRQVCG